MSDRRVKTWSYAAITAAAEARIRSLTDNSQASDPHAMRLRREWAYGVYLGWNELTLGWQNDGDDERLRTLTEAHSD
jgi:hypothetical protein